MSTSITAAVNDLLVLLLFIFMTLAVKASLALKWLLNYCIFHKCIYALCDGATFHIIKWRTPRSGVGHYLERVNWSYVQPVVTSGGLSGSERKACKQPSLREEEEDDEAHQGELLNAIPLSV